MLVRVERRRGDEKLCGIKIHLLIGVGKRYTFLGVLRKNVNDVSR